MLRLDGTPVMTQDPASGYDVWKPVGFADTWRAVMFSYEFPLVAAQTAVYAYELTGHETALASARAWATHIAADWPPGPGRRWGDELTAALPSDTPEGGTYAENYGRAISFYLRLHYATKDATYLARANSLANTAVGTLFDHGVIKGHPAKSVYQTTDGVGFLMYALLELAAYPRRLAVNL